MIENYILLTGGHTGLGLLVTKKLLTAGNKLGLVIRSKARQQETIDAIDLPDSLVAEIDFFYADLSDQTQVRALAAEISGVWPRIDYFFNNAAVLSTTRETSKHGNELHLEVNVLAPYMLITDLKPLLFAADGATVVTTVTAQMNSRKLRVDQIMDPNHKRGFNLYAQSKQAIMLLLNDLSADWPGVRFMAVDPGPNKTKMTTGSGAPWIVRTVIGRFFSDPEVGATRIYNAAFDPQLVNETTALVSGDKIRTVKHGMTAADKAALLAGIQE